MKTLLSRTSVLALTVAFLALSAQAGHCGDINPQPLPPCHHAASLVEFVLNLLHQLHF